MSISIRLISATRVTICVSARIRIVFSTQRAQKYRERDQKKVAVAEAIAVNKIGIQRNTNAIWYISVCEITKTYAYVTKVRR